MASSTDVFHNDGKYENWEVIVLKYLLSLSRLKSARLYAFVNLNSTVRFDKSGVKTYGVRALKVGYRSKNDCDFLTT